MQRKVIFWGSAAFLVLAVGITIGFAAAPAGETRVGLFGRYNLSGTWKEENGKYLLIVGDRFYWIDRDNKILGRGTVLVWNNGQNDKLLFPNDSGTLGTACAFSMDNNKLILSEGFGNIDGTYTRVH